MTEKAIGTHEAKAGAKFRGIWNIEVFEDQAAFDRGDKPIAVSECKNILTDEGLNKVLNVMLNGATQITTWYCVIFENDFTADGDETYAVPGYTETTAYDEATRPEYVEAASTAKSTTNSANKAVFTANATKTFYGAALVGGGSAATTKGDTAGGGTLLCAGKFTAAQPVIDGNVVNLTYTITAADAG
jgi:hypothetical protein